MEKHEVIYVYDENLCTECDRLPTMCNRATMVHDLITSYGLLNSLKVVKSEPATEDDLKLCHSSAYIDFLKLVNDCDDLEKYDEEQQEYGLGYDCPILDNLLDFVKVIAGGSLTAAKLLIHEKCKVAINWCGGWHHAQREAADGFCYVNDIAIAIQKLREKYKRILYIDFDIHHGDGVQNLFETSQKILTLSFHKYSPGFYPGSGSTNDIGYSNGIYYSLNFPFLEGLSDKSLLYSFDNIFPRVIDVFQPNAIVVQCGADGLQGDPLGQTNLTSKSVGQCVKKIVQIEVPCLVLGGGGYNFTNTARHWTYLTAIICDQELNPDIPDSSEFFTDYGPSFELEIVAGNMKDLNTKEYLDNIITILSQHCSYIKI